MMDILDAYRVRIAALDFTPLSDEAAAQARAAYAESVASTRIEGAEMALSVVRTFGTTRGVD